jgi:hypothetical protein
MSDSPLVTIGLPVYNSERYLRQSLNSLLAQTYRDFTLIINDNASTDGTARICEEYAAADSRVKCFRNETNIGNPRNFNRVFELTTTPYLKWSTADDFWEPTFLERAMQVMESDPTVALCYPKTYIVDADGANRRPVEDRLHLVQPDPADRFIGLLTNIGLAHQHLGVIRTAHLRQTHLLGVHVASDVNLRPALLPPVPQDLRKLEARRPRASGQALSRHHPAGHQDDQVAVSRTVLLGGGHVSAASAIQGPAVALPAETDDLGSPRPPRRAELQAGNPLAPISRPRRAPG